MKARISAGWAHDSGLNPFDIRATARTRISAGWALSCAHFSFYRQSPHDQARLPFVTEQTETTTDKVLCVLSIVLLAVGGFLVLGLS